MEPTFSSPRYVHISVSNIQVLSLGSCCCLSVDDTPALVCKATEVDDTGRHCGCAVLIHRHAGEVKELFFLQPGRETGRRGDAYFDHPPTHIQAIFIISSHEETDYPLCHLGERFYFNFNYSKISTSNYYSLGNF